MGASTGSRTAPAEAVTVDENDNGNRHQHHDMPDAHGMPEQGVRMGQGKPHARNLIPPGSAGNLPDPDRRQNFPCCFKDLFSLRNGANTKNALVRLSHAMAAGRLRAAFICGRHSPSPSMRLAQRGGGPEWDHRSLFRGPGKRINPPLIPTIRIGDRRVSRFAPHL